MSEGLFQDDFCHLEYHGWHRRIKPWYLGLGGDNDLI